MAESLAHAVELLMKSCPPGSEQERLRAAEDLLRTLSPERADAGLRALALYRLRFQLEGPSRLETS